MQSKYFKKISVFIICILFVHMAFGHVIVGELENLSRTETSVLYLKLGYQHILPLGLDHILFMLSLFLFSPDLKSIVRQCTAFTVAHSITLGLAMYHIITPPSAIIEPVISLSIIFVALENIFSKKLRSGRIGLIFLFGLVHGMGFASSLSELGLPDNNYFTSLVMFNVGVELGQLSVIILAFFLVGKWFSKKPFYRKVIVIPASVVIVLIASYWTVERILL